MKKVNSNVRWISDRCIPMYIGTIRGALCALLIWCISPAFGQWEQVPSGTTSYLKDIFFINASVGFCVGGGDLSGLPNSDPGLILRSTDGGTLWNTVLQGTGIAFTNVVAKGDTVICFGRSMTEACLLWASFDNGDSWAMDTLALTDGPHNPKFSGNDLLFLSNQDLLRYNLGTKTAQTLFIPNSASIFALDGNLIYLMTMDQTLHSSADAGLNWDTIPFFMADSIGFWSESYGDALFASGDTMIIKLNYEAVITYTMDHGQNWTTYMTNMWHVVFNSLDTLYTYLGGQQTGQISVSTDRGVSVEQQQQLGVRIGKVFFLPGTSHGWVCGENGMIYATTNGGFTTGVPDRLAPPGQLTVQPNPAHDRLTLVVPTGIQVERIELLDSALKRVRHYQPSVRVLNTQGLAVGQYLLKVGTDQGTQSIKVLLQ